MINVPVAGRDVDMSNPINLAHPLIAKNTLFAWYRCVQNAGHRGGVIWRDLARVRDGTLTNLTSPPCAQWRGGGRPGGDGAIAFNGSNAYVTTPLSDTVQNFTVGAWCFPTAVNAGVLRSVFVIGTAGYSFQLRQDGTNWASFYHNVSGDQGASSTFHLTINRWTHVVARYLNVTGNESKLYVDGKQVASAATSTGVPRLRMGGPLIVGGDGADFGGTPQNCWQGLLDDVRVFQSGNFDDQDVQNWYTLSKAGDPGLVNRVTTPESWPPGSYTPSLMPPQLPGGVPVQWSI
jgi:hypothetical protein